MLHGATIEECFHIGNINTNGTNNWVAGIVAECGGTNIRNCYNIGEIKGRGACGICSWHYANCFNCYSIGKITSSYCGGIIFGMQYNGQVAHCFGRRGDFRTLEEEPTEAEILANLSSYGAKGYESDVLTDEEMKTEDFLNELNILKVKDSDGNVIPTSQTVWKMDTEGLNGGYPIFVWQ